MNYWFKLQASAHSSSVVSQVEKLIQHQAFDLSNPNKIYALLGTFSNNPYGFHASSGEGYRLMSDTIFKLEQINPTIAARLTDKLTSFDKYDEHRQKMMITHLIRIKDKAISSDVKTMATKGLDKVKERLVASSVYSSQDS